MSREGSLKSLENSDTGGAIVLHTEVASDEEEED